MLCKKIKMLLCGAAALLCSCVDGTYDLSKKEVSLYMKVEDNKVVLPLGNLRAIMLDSLISVEDMPMLELLEDGMYGLRISENVDPVTVELDPIVLKLDPISQSADVSFDEVEVQDILLHEMVNTVDCGMASVSTDGLDDAMPQLQSSVRMKIVTPEMEEMVELLQANPQMEPITMEFDNRETPFVLEEQQVDYALEYALPKEIKYISTVEIVQGGVRRNTSNGGMVRFYVNHSEVLTGVEKSVSFKIDFPESFVLAKDPQAYGSDKYTLSEDKHSISVDNLSTMQNMTTIQFYIEELSGLENYTENGVLAIAEEITYSVEYAIAGAMEFTAETDLDKFEFAVTMDTDLSTGEISGMTNDIDLDFASVEYDFSSHLDGLEYVNEIEYILFDPELSKIIFTADLDGGFAPFGLTEDSRLSLAFPKNFYFDLEKSRYPKGTTYVETGEEHAFLISDIESLDGFEWQLAITRIDVYKQVIEGEFDLDGKVTLAAETGKLILKEQKVDALGATLENMASKNISFAFRESELHIDDAVVKTDYIVAECEEHHSLPLRAKVPDGLKRVEKVSFVDAAKIIVQLGVRGLEVLDAKTEVDIHLLVDMPPFLKLACDDEAVTIRQNGMVEIWKKYHSGEGDIVLELACTGLDFSSDEFAETRGLLPVVTADGDTRIDYTTDVSINATVGVDETELHANLLDTPIEVNLKIDIDDIMVKALSGEYAGELDAVNQSMDLDLGDELTFLKEEGNTIKLSEPQVLVSLDNSIGVPLNLNLSLVGKDENGNVIETSCIEVKNAHVEAADYDEATGELTPRQTRLLLTSDVEQVAVEGYTSIEVPELATLLQRMPSSFDMSLQPVVDRSVQHHVDLSNPLSFSGEYAVVVPFKFDEFQMSFTDTISGLQESMGDVLEMFSNFELTLKMVVENTIPVGLSLSALPLDVNEKVLNGITIEPFAIAAGDGGNILSGAKGKNAQLVLKGTAAQLKVLDKLLLTIDASADHTEGGVALRPEQGLRISDIAIEIGGDIEMDLNEKNKE